MNDERLIFSESGEVPKAKQYLLKYFSTDEQKTFLRYYFTFGEYSSFACRSGVPVSKRWLRRNFKKLQSLEAAHFKAKEDMDLETLADIEAGKYRLL